MLMIAMLAVVYVSVLSAQEAGAVTVRHRRVVRMQPRQAEVVVTKTTRHYVRH